MPTSLVMDCIDVLLPITTKMINLSLESGLFADDWKCALVLQLLKWKSGLDLIYKNYRPAVCLKADWKGRVWTDTHPYDDSFTVSRVSVCVKSIARKRLLLESWTIFSWKWTLKRSPCWSCSTLAPLLIWLIITSFLHVWMRSSGYADWPWNGSGLPG